MTPPRSEPSPPTIALTGATGTIGSELLRLLCGRDVAVRALSRDPDRGQRLPDVTWIEGDLADRTSLVGAFAGADRLFLLTGNADRMVQLQENAIRAAAEAGVMHVVKLSALGASDHSTSIIGTWHWIVEHKMKHADPAWTMLRPHHFMQNVLDQEEQILETGEVRSASGDGEIPFIDTRDIAAVAAEVLTSPGHAGRTYTLTGPEAISYREATEIFAEEIGRDLAYVAESPDEQRARRQAAGDPEWLIAAQLAIAAYQRAGGPTAKTTDTVEELIGRPPRSFRDFARDHANLFEV